jgi:hypothetical protein
VPRKQSIILGIAEKPAVPSNNPLYVPKPKLTGTARAVPRRRKLNAFHNPLLRDYERN